MVRKNLIAGIISAALLAGASVLAAGQAGAASETCQISRATCEYFGLPYKPHPTPSPSPGANPCAPKRPAPTAKPAKSRVTAPRSAPSGGVTMPTTSTRVGGQGAVTKGSPGPGPMYIPPPSDSQRFGSEDPEADRAIQSLGDLIRLRDGDLDKPVPFLRDPGPEAPRSTASIDQISVPSPAVTADGGFDWKTKLAGYLGASDESARWYADKYVETGDWRYALGGGVASLWTPDTYLQTAAVLGPSVVGMVARPLGLGAAAAAEADVSFTGIETGAPKLLTGPAQPSPINAFTGLRTVQEGTIYVTPSGVAVPSRAYYYGNQLVGISDPIRGTTIFDSGGYAPAFNRAYQRAMDAGIFSPGGSMYGGGP